MFNFLIEFFGVNHGIKLTKKHRFSPILYKKTKKSYLSFDKIRLCFQWSRWWESNPRSQLGRLKFCRWTTPAFKWSGLQDSNLWPSGPKPDALPSWAKSRNFYIKYYIIFTRDCQVNGAPGRIRTHNPLIRSQVFYPIELQAHSLINGGSNGTWTRDLQCDRLAC